MVEHYQPARAPKLAKVVENSKTLVHISATNRCLSASLKYQKIRNNRRWPGPAVAGQELAGGLMRIGFHGFDRGRAIANVQQTIRWRCTRPV
jgi:hypothetical protein